MRLGAFQAMEVLGRGGMGVVYRAEGPDGPVALKTVIVSGFGVDGLRREIRALAALRHPGIVRIVAHGVDDGVPWYAMELLRGRPLVTRTSAVTWWTQALAGDLSPAEGAAADDPIAAIAPFRALAETLAYVHGEGLVHRDLKPENVLLTEDGRPVLLDFGLTDRFGTHEVLDVRGGRVGTAAYMAPEQIRGDRADARADLYALGCMLYEAVAGGPPFAAPTVEGMLHAHLHAPPRDLTELGAPPRLARLVARLLEKDPDERLGYADTVARALADLGSTVTWEEAPRARAYVYRPPLIGRERARDELNARLARERIAFVCGPAGCGRTRLLSELGREARREGFQVLAGVAAEDGPVLEALERPMQALGLQLPPTGDLPPVAVRARVFAALAAGFEAAAAEKPVLLVLDDLHHADALTRSVLEHLASRPGVHVLGAFRSDLAPPDLAARLSVVLEPLDEPAVAAMIGAMLAWRPAPAALVDWALRHGDGKPYFVAELLRNAVDEGLLARDDDGRWSAATEWSRWDALSLPADLDSLLRRMLARLSGSEVAALRCVAVLGAADRRVLAAMHDDPADVESLVARRLLEGDADLRLAHSALRAIVLDGDAAALHRAAAQAMEAVLASPPAARIAQHWDEAGEPERARPAWLRAAREAVAVYALADADRAFARAGDDPAVRFERARVWYMQGRNAEAQAAHRAVVADPLTSPQTRLEALQLLAESLTQTGDFADARDALDAARALEASLGVEALGVWRCLGRLVYYSGDPAAALPIYESIVGRGDRRHQGLCQNAMGVLHLELGDLALAERHLREAEASFAAIEDRRELASAAHNLGNVAFLDGRFDDAREWYARAHAEHRAIGDRRATAAGLHGLGSVDAATGRLEAAAERHREAAGVLEAVGDRVNAAHAWIEACKVALAAGADPAAVEAELSPPRDLLLATVPSVAVLACCASVSVALAAGRREVAAAWLERARACAGDAPGTEATAALAQAEAELAART